MGDVWGVRTRVSGRGGAAAMRGFKLWGAVCLGFRGGHMGGEGLAVVGGDGAWG